MQQYKYKIQPLVEKGFDFNTIYPEKQEAVKEMSGYSFSIPEIVDFIKSQTNNFQQDNLVAFDLDDAIYKLYVKSTGGAKEAAAPTPPEAPAAPQGGDKADLENRLKILKKMFAKKPNDEDLKARVRTMEKRISKMADGGAVTYAKGGIFGDSQYNTGRSWHLDRYYHNTKEDWEKPMRKRKLKYFLGGGVGDIPVSEEKYSDMRDAVPPIYITTIDGHGVMNGFAVGEAYSHAITPDGHKALYTAYYTFGDKYYQVADLVYFVGSGQAKTMENVADVEYAKGGGISAKTNYLSHRNIDHIETKSGKVIKGKDVVDGAYVKKRVKFADGGDVEMGDEPKVVRQIFEDTEELEYAGGGGVEASPVKYGELEVGKEYYQVTRPDLGIEKITITKKENGTYSYYGDKYKEEEYVTKYQGRHTDNEELYGIYQDKDDAKAKAVMLLHEKMSKYAGGGLFEARPKSALMKDRAYKSDETWEKAYKRKKKPSNPRYKKKS